MVEKSSKLKGKIAIITGGGTGIGYGLALGLAKEGANIVINYCQSRPGAEDVVQKIKAMNGKAIPIKADISKARDVNFLIDKTIYNFGKIDILINNAAIAPWKPFLEIKEDLWNKVIDINLKGTFLCSQRAAKEMVKTGGGKIINITSTGGYGALRYLAHYCASKGGINLLTKVMALELAPYNIKVNAIGPGAIEVERNLRENPHYSEIHTPLIPLGRVGKPEDLVGLTVFLCSEESSYITGQIFYIDGGLLSYVPQPDYGLLIKKREDAE